MKEKHSHKITYTVFFLSRWRKTPANISMHQKRRFAKSLQHKAILMEEELRHDNTVIADAPPPVQPTPVMQQQPESLNQLPPPAVKRAIRRLGVGISKRQIFSAACPGALPKSCIHPGLAANG
jgi:hypothetical protein